MLKSLKVKIYTDSASFEHMMKQYKEPYISGFTTNPTLMKAAGITDYEAFAKQVLANIKDRPISFEVFADDMENMHRQAKKIAKLGSNVYVKIPITNSEGVSTVPLIESLSKEGVALNITAIMTLEQLKRVHAAVHKGSKAVLSVFAGRVADTGKDPIPLMQACRKFIGNDKNIELLWASTRELFNIMQADQCGADIITVPPDILKKLSMIGKDLDQLSLETVQMFKKDAESAGFSF